MHIMGDSEIVNLICIRESDSHYSLKKHYNPLNKITPAINLNLIHMLVVLKNKNKRDSY